MEPVAMTLIATASEPSPLEARAHAIKNCVSVILGLASTIEPHVDPIARPRFTQLMDTSRQLKELLARQATTCARVREDVPVAGVVRMVTDQLAPQAEACGVRLAIECGGGGILGDIGDLSEALYNVCSNALYASPADTTVRITTRTNPDGDHEWSVEDAGCGIPASVMPRLGRGGITTRDGGTGLGLSIALQAVTRHEGVMRIESIEGRGTTVIIWLPATRDTCLEQRLVAVTGPA
jgi:signal transduction histidine kinase